MSDKPQNTKTSLLTESEAWVTTAAVQAYSKLENAAILENAVINVPTKLTLEAGAVLFSKEHKVKLTDVAKSAVAANPLVMVALTANNGVKEAVLRDAGQVKAKGEDLAQKAYDVAQNALKVKSGDNKTIADIKTVASLDLRMKAFETRTCYQIGKGITKESIHHPIKLSAEVIGGAAVAAAGTTGALIAGGIGVGVGLGIGIYTGVEITCNEGISAIPRHLDSGYLSAKQTVIDTKNAAVNAVGAEMFPENYTPAQNAQAKETLQNAGAHLANAGAMFTGGLVAGPVKAAGVEALEVTAQISKKLTAEFADSVERLEWGGFKPAYEFVPAGTPNIKPQIPDYRTFASSPGRGLAALPVVHMADSAGGDTAGNGNSDNDGKQLRKPWEVISHRGRAEGENVDAPGNTLKAFENILARHPDISVETDVRFTKDGTLIVLHDNLLQLATNGDGFANEVTRETLRSLRVKTGGVITGERVPELEDVFKLFNGRGTIHLELKVGPDDPPGLLPEVLTLMEKYPNQRVALSSFDHATLLHVPADVPIGILSNAMPPDVPKYAAQFTLGGQRSLDDIAFHPDIWNLTVRAMAGAKSAGMPINAYTVPREMFKWTYDNGVNPITDHPEAALDFLNRQEKP